MYLEFFVAIVPLVCMLLFEAMSPNDLPLRVDKSLSIYDTGLRAAASYNVFMNGVSDAVDTGSLGSKALKALEDAKTQTSALMTDTKSKEAQVADETLTKIQAAVTKKNSIETLVELKSDIKGAEQQVNDSVLAVKRDLSKMVAEDARATAKRKNIFNGVAVATVLLLAALIRNMVQGVTRPIVQAVDTARHVASGDLTVTTDVTRHDEVGDLQAALRDMSTALTAIVSDVRESALQIEYGAIEIANGNQDLSVRTAQQSVCLEATSKSMATLTSTVAQNADSSRIANELAGKAGEVAARGSELVESVVSTMSAINAGSQKVSDITGVIEGIAFQTNILALNAAVEAARAGENGRGFAVVASEVRNLAQRSAAAAKEIKEVISTSVSEVRSGTKLVEEAGATMKEILTAVNRVTDMMDEIEKASAEQKAGIETVNSAIVDMDAMTQQNAAMVEEASTVAASVKDRTHSLSEAVGKFVLQESKPHKLLPYVA